MITAKQHRMNCDDEENPLKGMSPVVQKDEENIKKSFFSRHLSKSSLWRRLEGDKLHVCILLFLYTLQGIPYGLKFSIPLILTRRGVPYADQARFSISSYPWSMKVSNCSSNP